MLNAVNFFAPNEGQDCGTGLLSFEEYVAHDDGTENCYEPMDGLLDATISPALEHSLMAKFLEQVLDTENQPQQLALLILQEVGIRTEVSELWLTDVCIEYASNSLAKILEAKREVYVSEEI